MFTENKLFSILFKYKKIFLKLIFIIILIFDIIIFILVDPFNIFLEKSSQFTLDTFKKAKKGDHISKVIDLLGEPIKIESFDKGNKAYIFCYPISTKILGLRCFLYVDNKGYVYYRHIGY